MADGLSEEKETLLIDGRRIDIRLYSGFLKLSL